MQSASVWEILGYLLVIAYLQCKVFLHGSQFSDQAAARVQLPGLQPGWMLGRQVDLSDIQWRDFRGSLLMLSAAMAGFLLLSHGVRWLGARGDQRTAFYVACSIAFLGVLHGSCLVHVLLLTVGHFVITNSLAGTKYGLGVIWAATCGVFILVRVYEGVPFAMISPALAALDAHRGMLRWHIHYNLLVLRMLSFSCDLHWARTKRPVHQSRQAAVAADAAGKARVSQHLPLGAYSLVNYLAYTLYLPLYIAGPIITFNNFASQLTSAAAAVKPRQVLLYALRWGTALLALEVLTHTLYFNSIAKHRAWPLLEQSGLHVAPLHYAEGSYWILVFMWLKFSVLWKFFRLVSLADGFDAPENMTRCVCNNYDIEGFWRSWHASYNQWLVRYLYVPLGGSRWRLANVWIIFTFVALWHDLEWKLLGWAWIMALALTPEMGVKAFARSKWAQSVSHTWLWRQGCVLAAALNVVILMAGCMVGFVVGVDGVVQLLAKLTERPLFLLGTLGTLFSAVQLMFALREWEQRRSRAAQEKAVEGACKQGQ